MDRMTMMKDGTEMSRDFFSNFSEENTLSLYLHLDPLQQRESKIITSGIYSDWLELCVPATPACRDLWPAQLMVIVKERQTGIWCLGWSHKAT